MKATGVASSGIVHQVLTKDNIKDNYKRWSVVMENYLKGQDLWDVVESDSKSETPDIEQGLPGDVGSVSDDETKASWKMKNAQALHIIQLSCAEEILDEIRYCQTAKEAWNHLIELYSSTLAPPQADTQNSREDILVYSLLKQVEAGIQDPSSDSGWTRLHDAVINEDVNYVKMIVEEGEDGLLCMQDNDNGYTALALAARFTGNTDIAKLMVESKEGISEWLLEKPNKNGEIPVLLAAAGGYKEMTTYLYDKTPETVFAGEDPRNRVILLARCIAAEIFGVALRLLTRYPDLANESVAANYSTEQLLGKRVEGDFFVLEVLAKMPFAFPSGNRFGFGQQFIYNFLSVERKFINSYRINDIASYIQSVTCVADKRRTNLDSDSPPCSHHLFALLLHGIAYLLVRIFKCLNIFGVRKIYDKKYTHYEVLGILRYFCQSIADFSELQLREASAYGAMLHAAQHGTVEFINAMREAKPDLLSAVDSCQRGVFSYAVLNRKQNVFQLMHYLNGRKEIFRYRRDAFGNNLLHLAAHLGPSSDLDTSSGAALQMQREIQWFKAVEKVVHPLCKEATNSDGKKPYELFTENRKNLLKEGEEWAKNTAGSFTIVGTLITTIMFAALFTVPGGNNQGNGKPIFSQDTLFTTFLIADGLSFLTSATSIIIFIGMQTSRYAEKDFLVSLPLKLLSGLSSLIFSVSSMIVAFCAALGIVLKGYQTDRWLVIVPILVPILFLAISTINVLVESHLPLMYGIFLAIRKTLVTRKSLLLTVVVCLIVFH